jgi:hypothetical protein
LQNIASIFDFTNINLEGVAFVISIQVSVWEQAIGEQREEDEFGEGE